MACPSGSRRLTAPAFVFLGRRASATLEPMILSHAHRFIFIKTPKSAGTSIELALAPLCGADDVITPVLETTTEARNYLLGPPPLRYDRDYYNHMGLQQVARHAGLETAARYFKFAFVRN